MKNKYASEQFVNESLTGALLAYAALKGATKYAPGVLRAINPISKAKRLVTVTLHGANKTVTVVRRGINYMKHKRELNALRRKEGLIK